MTSTSNDANLNRQQNVEQFEEFVNELKMIQQKVDTLLFESVFLRKPQGCLDENCKL